MARIIKKKPIPIYDNKGNKLPDDFGKSGGAFKIGENLKNQTQNENETLEAETRRQARKDLATQNIAADEIKKIGGTDEQIKKAQTQTSTSVQVTDNSEQLEQQQGELPSLEEIKQNNGLIPTKTIPINQMLADVTGLPFNVQQQPEFLFSSPEEADARFTKLFGMAAKSYDFIQSIFDEGKSVEFKAYEGSFADIKASLTMQEQLVNSGLANPADVTENIKQGYLILSKLEMYQQSLSSKNLRYFLTEGIDVETSIIEHKQYLDGLYKRLKQQEIAAQQQNKISKFGVSQ